MQNGRPPAVKKCWVPTWPGRRCANRRSPKLVGSSGNGIRRGANKPSPASARRLPSTRSKPGTRPPRASPRCWRRRTRRRRAALKAAGVQGGDPARRREHAPAPAAGKLDRQPVRLDDHVAPDRRARPPPRPRARRRPPMPRARVIAPAAVQGQQLGRRPDPRAGQQRQPRTAPKQPMITAPPANSATERGQQRHVGGGAGDHGGDTQTQLDPETQARTPSRGTRPTSAR